MNIGIATCQTIHIHYSAPIDIFATYSSHGIYTHLRWMQNFNVQNFANPPADHPNLVSGMLQDLRQYMPFHLTFNSPVDIFVYNSKGYVIGKIVNSVAENMIDSDTFLFTMDDAKHLIMPSGMFHTIRLYATDSGTLTYTKNIIDMLSDTLIPAGTFENVTLYTGREFLVQSTGGFANRLLIARDGIPIYEVLSDGTETPLPQPNTTRNIFIAIVIVTGITISIFVLLIIKNFNSKNKNHKARSHSTMFCSQCGKAQKSADVIYCGQCGTKIHKSVPKQVNAPRKTFRLKIIFTIVALVIIVGGIGFYFLFTSSFFNQTTSSDTPDLGIYHNIDDEDMQTNTYSQHPQESDQEATQDPDTNEYAQTSTEPEQETTQEPVHEPEQDSDISEPPTETVPPPRNPDDYQLLMQFTMNSAIYYYRGNQYEFWTETVADHATGRMMVSIHRVASAFGAWAEWDGIGFYHYIVYDDERFPFVTGVPLPDNSGTPFFIGSSTFAPLIYLANIFGAVVEWDGATQTASVYVRLP